ncbi:hypothetical protein R1sor_015402 [Riccia sorocarpa]|uniref:Heat shock protein 70 n=1 Tax=Riccia sorocarpa TaxID=122646 RepID=A0ABD3HCK3_9MARC
MFVAAGSDPVDRVVIFDIGSSGSLEAVDITMGARGDNLDTDFVALLVVMLAASDFLPVKFLWTSLIEKCKDVIFVFLMTSPIEKGKGVGFEGRIKLEESACDKSVNAQYLWTIRCLWISILYLVCSLAY